MERPVGPHASGWWVVAVLLLGATACARPVDVARDASLGPSTPIATAHEVALPTPTSAGPEAYPEDSALRFLRGDGRFGTFVAIIEQGGIGRALELWSDPHHDATIFAPTDEAFRRVDPTLLEAAMDERVLPRLVTNHVLSEPFRLAEFDHGQALQTLGVELTVRRTGDAVGVAGIPIAEGDLEAGVTIIHVIDELILPCNDAYLQDVLGPDFARDCGS